MQIGSQEWRYPLTQGGDIDHSRCTYLATRCGLSATGRRKHHSMNEKNWPNPEVDNRLYSRAIGLLQDVHAQIDGDGEVSINTNHRIAKLLDASYAQTLKKVNDLRIGSQEWRNDTYYDHGVYILDAGGFTLLSTRCGITAPGRSAGSVHFWQLLEPLEFRWVIDGHSWHKTRAAAAAAAYVAWYREATSNMPESTRLHG